MKKIGYLILTVGFLSGSLAAVVDESNVRWGYFIVALLAGVAGIIMVRLAEHRDKRSDKKVTANLQDIRNSLNRIVENITRLNTEKQSVNPYDFHHRIDELFSEDLTTFVEARESLTQAYGLQVYADIMSHFASGERYLNRVWSASADGYIDEVITYLEKAQMQFVETLARVRDL
ncbi:hypothetical protein ACFL1G_04345 [Planctomycetota bacterium]